VEDAQPGRALIVAGGEPIAANLLTRLAEPAWVVAADSGLDQAFRLGIEPDLVVGDMDSVTTEALQRAAAAGVAIERHPVAKDATDLELAIAAAMRAGFTRATIIGGTGGRMAHTLANAMILLGDRPIELEWLTGEAIIVPLRAGERRSYRRVDGELLSVVAVGGAATCTATGLRWPLDGITIDAGSTRGVSNEIVADEAQVLVEGGHILTVQERN
jgi:thiamine pyrophosphokinase